ncbi:MAG: hypothetical protein ACI4PF_00635 [Christensenellales bacterium]
MPFVEDLPIKGLVQEETKSSWQDAPLNQKAKEDFCYIVNKSGLAYFNKLGHVIVTGAGNKTLAECVVVGVNQKEKQTAIPAFEFTDSDEYGKVVVVIYANDAVDGIYLFGYPEVKKGGLMSRFKFLKKTNEYLIKTSGIEKCAENKFGVVFGKSIK